MDKKTELDFVDGDIAEYFKQRWPDKEVVPGHIVPGEDFWNVGLAIQMQLAKYMKRLCELMENAEKLKKR